MLEVWERAALTLAAARGVEPIPANDDARLEHSDVDGASDRYGQSVEITLATDEWASEENPLPALDVALNGSRSTLADPRRLFAALALIPDNLDHLSPAPLD